MLIRFYTSFHGFVHFSLFLAGFRANQSPLVRSQAFCRWTPLPALLKLGLIWDSLLDPIPRIGVSESPQLSL